MCFDIVVMCVAQEVYEELLKLSESEDFVKIMSSDMKSTSPAQKYVCVIFEIFDIVTVL